MKNSIIFLLFTLSVTSCVTSKKSKQVLCPTQTPNQFLFQELKKLGIRNIDTSDILFVKPTKKHLPRLGDVIITDGKMYVIIDKPTPIYGKAGQTIFNTGDPAKNGGHWLTWWKYRAVSQGKNCTTIVARSNSDTKIQKFTRLQKF